MIVSIMIVESALIHIICKLWTPKWHDCERYNGELGCYKLLSDWIEAMPILIPCVDTPCGHCIIE